jgi:transcriptional regulator with XRE-family HTH domain
MRNDLGRVLYARNLREHELARRTGLTESHLNRIKNGRAMPSLETALRICAALGLPVESVFRLEKEPARGRIRRSPLQTRGQRQPRRHAPGPPSA